jgi:hypothetical protein
MSDLYGFATAFWGFIGAAAVVFAFQLVYWPTLSDETRQRLFAIRRELFIYMADGRIRPTDPAYVALRSSINSLLLFADRLSFLRLVMDGLLWRRRGAKLSADFKNRIMAVEDESVRRDLMGFNDRMLSQMVRHLVWSSPVLWVVLLVVGGVAIPLRLVADIRGLKAAVIQTSLRNRSAFDGVQAEAEYLSNGTAAEAA